MTEHLTTAEAAERLRETPATVARACSAGTIPAVKVGRQWLIPSEVVERMLKPSNVKTAVRSTAGRRRSA